MEPKVPFSTNTFTYIMMNQKALIKYIQNKNFIIKKLH